MAPDIITNGTDCNFVTREYDGVDYLYIDIGNTEGILSKLSEMRLVPRQGVSSHQIAGIEAKLNECFMSIEWHE